MTRTFFTDNHKTAFAADHFAIFTAYFDGSLYFHEMCLNLTSESDAALGQIIGSHLHGHHVTRQDADFIHAHLTGKMGQDLMTILQLHPKRGAGQEFLNRAAHFQETFVFFLGTRETIGGISGAIPRYKFLGLFRFI